MLTDVELVARAPHDHAAFEALYEKYRLHAMRSATRWVGSWDQAEDVAQQVFLLLAEGRWRPDPRITGGDLKPLIATMVRLAAWKRDREREHAALPEPGDDWHDTTPRASGPSPEELVLQIERAQAWRRAGATLKPRDQEIFRRRFLEEQSIADVAFALGTTPGAIAARLGRIRQHLRAHLGDLYPLPEPARGGKGRTRGLYDKTNSSNNGSEGLSKFNAKRTLARATRTPPQHSPTPSAPPRASEASHPCQ